MTNLSGIDYLIAGFVLITKPGVRRFVMIPLLINVMVFIGLFFVFRHYWNEFNLWFAHFLPTWLQWLSYVLWLVFFIGFFLIFIYTFMTVGSIIAAPFNGLLAEQVEYYLTGTLPAQRSLFENIKDVPRILGRQLAIIGYFVPRALAILLLFFVPVVQAVAALVWFLFNAWFMTLTYVDFPTDNHRIPLSIVREKLGEKRLLALMFGVGIVVVAMIPFLNCFVMPAAVAGATKLWVEEFSVYGSKKSLGNHSA